MIDMKFHVWLGKNLDDYTQRIGKGIDRILGTPDFIIDAPETNNDRVDSGDMCISLGHDLRALVLWEG